MTTLTGYEFVKQFEKVVPTWLAEERDPIGLHVGDLSRPVTKIMVTLDVRPEVVQEAIEHGVDFILAHHPPIYSPIARLDLSNPQINMYADLIKHDITVYAAHTNLDNAQGGMNDWLADQLQLEDVEVMAVSKTIPLKRLSVYAPKEHAEAVRIAMTKAGAGHVTDNYKDCSYSIEGKGRFTPINDADPTIGEVNQAEVVEEERIEVVVEERYLSEVIFAMKQAHPYEEAVYDSFSIDQKQAQAYGLGRVGNLKEDMSVLDFVTYVKQAFQVDGLRVTAPQNNLNQTIRRVALCGGDAGKYYQKAIDKQADVYITGDVYYHTAHDMQAAGLLVIDPGHHIEKVCIPKLYDMVNEWRSELGWQIELMSSTIDTNPFLFDSQL